MKKYILSLMCVGLFVSCAEDRDNKALSRVDVFSKQSIDLNAEYLYVPSTEEVSYAANSYPYWQGDQRIVKLKFERSKLVAYSVEEQDSLNENTANNKPVFEIPIKHIDFRELKDSFGEGTNQEEENRYLSWDKKDYFVPTQDQFKFLDVNLLPSQFGELFGSSSCTKETRAFNTTFDVSPDVITFGMQRTYRTNLRCRNNVVFFEDIDNLQWEEKTTYSLVKMEKVASKNYKTKVYAPEWERTFGFFQRAEREYNSSNVQTQTNERFLMERWNPERENITYFLDDDLYKPKNKVLLDSTLEAIKRVNLGLEDAGVKFKISTEKSEGKLTGDLRYSSITIVEDPLAVNLLGYGPSVSNPRTGEIVQARTIMYPGVFRKFIQYSYEDLVNQVKSESAVAGITDQITTLMAQYNEGPDNVKSLTTLSDWKYNEGPLGDWTVVADAGVASDATESDAANDTSTNEGAVSLVLNKANLDLPGFDKNDYSQENHIIHGGLSPFELLKGAQFSIDHDSIETPEDLLAHDHEHFFSMNNMYEAKAEKFSELTFSVYRDQIEAISGLKPWNELSEDIQEQIIEIILPQEWIATLIHEIGHNLGLRHNFQGSEDSQNYYSLNELEEKDAASEIQKTYSSIMDYPKTDINSLKLLGKYDVAALRYGYTNKVEVVDSSIVNTLDELDSFEELETTIVDVGESLPEELTLKPYKYCTDSGVSLNPTCNRRDEGTTYTEIVDSMIDSYWQRYKLRNFRRDRANFSKYDEIGYAIGTMNTFYYLRLSFETASRIMIDFKEAFTGPESVEQIAWFKDLNDASVKVADFFMEIVGEPELHCVYEVPTEDGGTAAQIYDHNLIKEAFEDPNSTGCFNLTNNGSINFPFEPVASVGRPLNDIRFNSNPNIYLDQIDVRGVWIDKLLASRYLFKRTMGYSFDEHTVNFLTHPSIGPKVNEFIKNLSLGLVTHPQSFKDAQGNITKAPFLHNFVNPDLYTVRQPLLRVIPRVFGVPYRNVNVNEIVLSAAANALYDGEYDQSTYDFGENLDVYSALTEVNNDEIVNSLSLGNKTYFATKNNEVANQVFKLNEILDAKDSLGTEKFESLLAPVLFGTETELAAAMATATDEEKVILEAPKEILSLYYYQIFPDKEFVLKTLDSLQRF